MSDLDAAVRASLRERATFFRQYYGPLGANSRHGLAVIDPTHCALLFANRRFLASHGMSPTAEMPVRCTVVYGVGACDAEVDSCPAAVAARARYEVRRTVPRLGGDGLPARTTEVIAAPIGNKSLLGRGTEVLIVEKEDSVPTADGDEEREHLAAIARHSADAIIGLDMSGQITSWNQGAADIFGYTDDESIGRDFTFLLPDDALSRREHEAMLREFEGRGLLRNHKLRLSAKDGRAVVGSITRSYVKDVTGTPRGLSVICRDETMETLLRELIEHQLRAMSVTHEIGDLLHSTRTVDEILQLILVGVTASQGLGFNRAFLLLVEGEGASARLRGKNAIGPSNAEEANRIWSRLSTETLTLTELHRRYQEECRDGDSRVNEIVRKIDLPLAPPAVPGGRAGADPAQEHVLRRVIRTHRAVNVIQARVAGEESEVDRGLIDLLANDSFAVVPLNTRDRALGVLLVDNQITGLAVSDADLQMLKVFANHAGIALENSQLRANLERRLEELEALNRALRENQEKSVKSERLAIIGELAARVVHEVRNPLVAIGGFARLVRRGMEPEDPRSDYLRIISDEVARLERIVQELLDFSRPQNRVRTEVVELNQLVHEVVSIATVEAASHDVVVTEDLGADIGQVRIDTDKTRQVLINILRNAVDVLVERGGTLGVETRALDADRVRVTICDNGPGIPADRREQVFQPGFTTRPDGTGFGLAIAKRLIELQGGTVGLREGVAQGCTFDVLLPRQVADHAGSTDWAGPGVTERT